MSKTIHKVGKSQILAAVFHVDPKKDKIRFIRSDNDNNGKACDSFEDAQPIEKFATSQTRFIFSSGLHTSVRLRKNETGQEIKPKQAIAYWNPVGLRMGEGISAEKKEDKYANGVFFIDETRIANITPLASFKDPEVTSGKYTMVLQSGPLLVNDGTAVANLDTTYSMGLTPKAIIGIAKSGALLFARIEGEISLKEAGDFMVEQGAIHAIGLQGDSGAIFWNEGKVSATTNRKPPNFCEVIVVE